MFGYYLDLALRSLKRRPILTSLMVLAIGLGIGSSMTMITVLHVMTTDPLPGRSAMLFTPHLDPLPLAHKHRDEGPDPTDNLTWPDAMALLKAHRAERQVAMAGGRVLLRPARADVRALYVTGRYGTWRAAVWLLASVCLVVVMVTAIGIMGLTGYWVQQRTRHIGIRRALGARRVDILRYFLLENLLIVGIGIAVGMVLAYGINVYLMRHYELERLPWAWLPTGALALWLLGQLAVLGPALHAAAVPPVVATRSV